MFGSESTVDGLFFIEHPDTPSLRRTRLALASSTNATADAPKTSSMYGGGTLEIDLENEDVMKMFLFGAMDAFTDCPF
ncbi:MAG: hypothetical protein IIB38_04200 [Candidatus Hydrogenedentes bacterium]|nr:hypothetical protein [Candidatus Hydrogenedentota bacterium]